MRILPNSQGFRYAGLPPAWNTGAKERARQGVIRLDQALRRLEPGWSIRTHQNQSRLR